MSDSMPEKTSDAVQMSDQFGVPLRESCLYASCYCEENVWQLCKAIQDENDQSLGQFMVVFISNCSKTIPLWNQKAGLADDDGFVLWDYHVILLRNTSDANQHCQVYDLDTTLSFPCSFEEYYDRAIKPDNTFPEAYRRRFRVLSASDYLAMFSSDRSHMRNASGEWIRPPPPWPSILPSQSNIHLFWSMETGKENSINDVSEILDTRCLTEKFSHSVA